MKFEFDSELSTGYIYIQELSEDEKVGTLGPFKVYLDFDMQENLVGIEILGEIDE